MSSLKLTQYDPVGSNGAATIFEDVCYGLTAALFVDSDGGPTEYNA